MGVCLLVVNEDITCRHIVSHLLKFCRYQEVRRGRFEDALLVILDKGLQQKNPVLITNVQRLGKMGQQIIAQIRGIFTTEIFHMKPDDKELRPELHQQFSASTYILQISDMAEIQAHWKSVLVKDKPGGGICGADDDHVAKATMVNISGINDEPGLDQNEKRKQRNESEEIEASPVEKKARVVWTQEMHRKFVDAVEKLGPDNIVPKKIMELMNEPGLTRENVASHLQECPFLLQKYRLGLKRGEVEASCAKSGSEPNLTSLHLSEYSEPYAFLFQKYSLGLSWPFTGPQCSIPCTSGCNQGIIQNIPKFSDHLGGLMQMESNNSMEHPLSCYSYNFRIYGDETMNMLISTEDGSSSSNATIPRNSENLFSSFTGLIFSKDGKLQLGRTSVSATDDQLRTGKFNPVGVTIGAGINDHSNPLASAPEAQNALPHNDSNDLLDVSDYCPLDEELFVPFLVDSGKEDNVSRCSSLPLECPTLEQNYILPPPSTSEFPISPSTPSFVEVPVRLTTPEDLFNQGLSSPELRNPGFLHSLEYPSAPASGATMVPLEEDDGIEKYLEEEINVLLNEAELVSPRMFWGQLFGYANYNLV